MIEFIILFFAAAAAFCIGNIVGYASGKDYGEKKATFEAIMRHVEPRMNVRVSREREQMIDHISRQSLAFSQKQKQWIKVYDAEIIDE